MQIGKLEIAPWNRQNFIPRLVALGLVAAWLIWGVFIWREGRILAEREREYQLEQQRQEERLRRLKAYDQSRLEEQFNRNNSRNAVDTFN